MEYQFVIYRTVAKYWRVSRRLTYGRLSLAVVEVKGVVVVKVRFDRIEVQQDVVKLLEEEKACRHALTPRNSVTLTR